MTKTGGDWMAQNQLAKALEHYKVDSGRTSSDIAEALGVTRATLWSKVNGNTPINIKQAKQLADMLGISLEDFYLIAPNMEQ
jgi:plasmid maintenance system antidote protein VapI